MLKLIELFAGIGACSKALTNLGIEHEIVDCVEIDKYAVKSFNAVHGTDFEPQDITKWDKDIECDLIMHGSPCQDFSVAGKQAGGDEGSGTRSSLMYETLRIVEKLKPKYVIWENVKNLLSKKHRHNFDAYLEAMEKLGYKNYYQVLNAKDYGVPQNRERVFTISIRKDINDNEFIFPEPMPLEKRLKDMLEDEVDEKYYLSETRLDVIYKWEQRQKENGRGFRFEVKDGESVARAITTSGDRPSSTNYVQDKPKIVKVGNLDIKGQDCIKRVYSSSGLSPTLTNMQGGNRQPKVVEPFVVASRGRGKNNKQHLEPRFDGTTNTLTSVQKDNYVAIRTANKRGYDLATEGDGVDLAYPKSTTRRGRVGHGVSKTITTSDNMAVVIDKSVKPSVAKNFEREKEKIIKSNKEMYHCKTTSGWSDNVVGLKIIPALRAGNSSTYGMTSNYRIRKLTPKECWRLMGFDDSDFEKAEKVNSNTQLYKQAGNSIVVDVLEAILRELLC